VTCCAVLRLLAPRAAVLNDFEAVGYGILALGPQDLIDINNIPAKPQVSQPLHSLLCHAAVPCWPR
jgi:glucokinase